LKQAAHRVPPLPARRLDDHLGIIEIATCKPDRNDLDRIQMTKEIYYGRQESKEQREEKEKAGQQAREEEETGSYFFHDR